MKTPEEWLDEGRPISGWVDYIRAIQQDARRQGYTEAAEIARKESGAGYEGEDLKTLILTARDNLTTP